MEFVLFMGTVSEKFILHIDIFIRSSYNDGIGRIMQKNYIGDMSGEGR